MASKNKNFDFTNFSTSIIRTIDSIRSKGISGSKDPVESRINAFYRAIGLPSVLIYKTLEKDSEDGKQRIDSKNNGNLFPSKEFVISDVEKVTLEKREYEYLIPISDQEVQRFFDYNEAGVADGAGDANTGLRLRGKLFPMIVNGDIEIFPKNKRVAPAFIEEKNLTDEKVKYNRPFIEAVLALKLSGEGVLDSSKSVSVAVELEMKKIAEEIPDVLEISSYNLSDIITNVVDNVNKVRRQLGADIKPSIDNIPQQNPEIITDANKKGQLDKTKENQDTEKIKRQARLAIFEFDDSSSASESKTRNLKTSLFMSQLLDVVVGSSGTIGKSIAETEQKISKQTKNIKDAYKELDLVLGIYTGLSGTDVLAIMMALFELDVNVLASLLNEDSRRNLERYKGFDETSISYISAKSAIKELENRVSEILKVIDEQIKITKPKQQVTKKSRKK